MNTTRAKVARLLIEYFGPDDRRIEHALKVLCQAERLYQAAPAGDEDILIAVALLHDIGIKVSEQELGYNTGKTQELYGPPIAERLLQSIAFPPQKIEIVKAIIGTHHTPLREEGPELKLLKEADRIVNQQESEAGG